MLALGDGRTATLTETMGAGEHSTVYRGWTEDAYRLKRRVALKVFNRAPVDGDALAKLARAVRHAALILHPNVAHTYAMGVGEDGVPFIVQELVTGCSLARLALAYARSKRRFPIDLALFIGVDVAEALLGARRVPTPDGTVLGITHHDLSPRQVLLSWEGEVKVTDFGLRAALPAGSGLRDMQRLIRRASYLAPEVLQGERGDAKSDVFSLGIMLLELLRGPRFPEGATEVEVLGYAKQGYVHIRVTDPILPEDIASVIARAVQIDPRDRYPHAGVFAYDLRRAAMAMGVGDGRSFLRQALADMSEILFVADEPGASAVDTQREQMAEALLEQSGELPAIAPSKSGPWLKGQ